MRRIHKLWSVHDTIFSVVSTPFSISIYEIWILLWRERCRNTVLFSSCINFCIKRTGWKKNHFSIPGCNSVDPCFFLKRACLWIFFLEAVQFFFHSGNIGWIIRIYLFGLFKIFFFIESITCHHAFLLSCLKNLKLPSMQFCLLLPEILFHNHLLKIYVSQINRCLFSHP